MTALATGEDDQIKSSMRKVALTALAGTSIEWYDFFSMPLQQLLSFKCFFPDSSPTIGLILSFEPSPSVSSQGLWAACCSATLVIASGAKKLW